MHTHIFVITNVVIYILKALWSVEVTALTATLLLLFKFNLIMLKNVLNVMAQYFVFHYVNKL